MDNTITAEPSDALSVFTTTAEASHALSVFTITAETVEYYAHEIGYLSRENDFLIGAEITKHSAALRYSIQLIRTLTLVVMSWRHEKEQLIISFTIAIGI